MYSHCRKFKTLVPFFLFYLSACSGLGLSPAYQAKFIFRGQVTNEQNKPLENVWVKVRGWETLTDANGRWKQEQVVYCGAMRDHPSSFVAEDVVLVSAPGFESQEHRFEVKHPAWFQGCESEQVLEFETILNPKGRAKLENQQEIGKGIQI